MLCNPLGKQWNVHVSTWEQSREAPWTRRHSFFSNLTSICNYVYACVSVHTSAGSLRPEEGVGSLGTRGAGGCELPAEGAGHWTLILCESTVVSELMNSLCRPQMLAAFRVVNMFIIPSLVVGLRVRTYNKTHALTVCIYYIFIKIFCVPIKLH